MDPLDLDHRLTPIRLAFHHCQNRLHQDPSIQDWRNGLVQQHLGCRVHHHAQLLRLMRSHQAFLSLIAIRSCQGSYQQGPTVPLKNRRGFHHRLDISSECCLILQVHQHHFRDVRVYHQRSYRSTRDLIGVVQMEYQSRVQLDFVRSDHRASLPEPLLDYLKLQDSVFAGRQFCWVYPSHWHRKRNATKGLHHRDLSQTRASSCRALCQHRGPVRPQGRYRAQVPLPQRCHPPRQT